MRSAYETLRLDRLEVVHAGTERFALAKASAPCRRPP